MEKINFEDGQLTKKGYVVIDGKEYLINEAQYDGATPLSSYVLNKMQDNIEEGINNIQALPTGGTKGQVLTKQSKTEGDANWEDIEANEVYIGNPAEAPNSAKIIVEDEDFGEGSTLSKAEVYVGAEEPTTGEKVWFNKNKNSIYVRNSNGVYEEFIKKSEEVYSTEEQRIGTWIDGKPLYRKVLSLTTPSTTNSTKIANFDKTFIIKNYYGNAFISASNQLLPINFYFTDVYKIATYVVNNSGEIYMKIGSEAYRNQQATLTIEYTKTTD